MTEKQRSLGTRVKVEIRGRITDKAIFEAVCRAADADFGCKKGAVREILLKAVLEGKRATINGFCSDGKPLRLTDLARELRIPVVFHIDCEAGKNHGEVYFTNPKFGISPSLPMTSAGPAVTGELINNMLRENPFYGLEVISKSLRWYNPETYPSFTMPRSLQVELMPEEKIGLLAGMRR
jgi:hypothetical protein